MREKVLLFIVSYNASNTLHSVLQRIPESLRDDQRFSTDVLVIDDCSPDNTFITSYEFLKNFDTFPVKILKNPNNLGYGGNQKVGYQYAIDNEYDYVALVHGDGQYAPELIPELLEPLLKKEAQAVFGSRMMLPKKALEGGMPYYKYLGNKILTGIENKLAKTELSEYHSGLRLYSVSALAKLPIAYNSDYFDFDTDIILQFSRAGFRIEEIPIPTHYGDEICHVDGLRYARLILTSCLLARCQDWGIFYHPKFDLSVAESDLESKSPYRPKLDFPSSHSIALDFVKDDDIVLLFGSSNPELGEAISERAGAVTEIPTLEKLEENLESLSAHAKPFNKILLIDVVSRLDRPERLLSIIRNTNHFASADVLIIVGNVGFLPVRLMLFLGYFNYSNRGILDKVHKRLFTFSSLSALLIQQGFKIVEIGGLPAPYPLAFGHSRLSELLLRLNSWAIRVSRRLFSYQLCYSVRARPTVDSLLSQAFSNSTSEIEHYERSVSLNDSEARG